MTYSATPSPVYDSFQLALSAPKLTASGTLSLSRYGRAAEETHRQVGGHGPFAVWGTG